MDTESVASVIGDFAIALSFFAALIFGLVQVRTAAADRRERLTLETVRGLQTREIAAHFQRMRDHDLPPTMDELGRLPADEQVSIIHYAQQMEMLGLMVYDGFIGLDLVERTLGDYVAYSWQKYKPFTEDGRERDPYLGEYFEWLANRLEEYMRDYHRPPAYTPDGAKGAAR